MAKFMYWDKSSLSKDDREDDAAQRTRRLTTGSMEPITESEHESETYMYYDNITQTIQDKAPHYNPQHHYRHHRHHHNNHHRHHKHYMTNNMLANQKVAEFYNSGGDTSSVEFGEKTPLLGGTRERESTKLKQFQADLRRLSVSKTLISVTLSVLTLVSMVTMMVSMPLYTGAMTDSGSDAYLAITVAMFWMPFFYFGLLLLTKIFIDKNTMLVPTTSWSNILLVAFCSSLNSLLIAYASVPSRTPTYLQSMFTTFQVPYTVISRYLILKKVPTLRHMLCILVLFIGMFIALEPVIFQINNSAGGNTQWFWPVIFALGWLPICIGYVFVEKSQQVTEAQTLVYVCYVQLFMYGFNICFFWTDLIPNFGMATSTRDFFHSVEKGIFCFYGADPTCSQVPALGATFILSYCCANMFNFFMIRYSEAVYAVVVVALVTPIGTIFWMLFEAIPTLHWQPVFNLNAVFVLAGLVIMMPAVAMYTYFSIQDDAVLETLPLKIMKARRAELQKKLPPRTRRATEGPQPTEEWDFPRSQWQVRPTSKPKTIHGKVKKKRGIPRSQSAPNFIGF